MKPVIGSNKVGLCVWTDAVPNTLVPSGTEPPMVIYTCNDEGTVCMSSESGLTPTYHPHKNISRVYYFKCAWNKIFTLSEDVIWSLERLLMDLLLIY